MTFTILLRRHGTKSDDPFLHAVWPDAPIEDVPGVGEVRYSLCNLATELDEPVGRGWLACAACRRREVELHKAAQPDKKDPTVFIHEPGLTAVEQIFGQELTPQERAEVNELARAFLAGDMDGYDAAMGRLSAMTGADQGAVIGATMLDLQAREAFRAGDRETARCYRALSEARFDERIQTAARLVGLLSIGLQAGELPDYEYDYLANGLLTWDGWYPDKTPVVDEPTARVWLETIQRIDVPPANKER